jgi:phosphoglycolate phosphatase
MYIPSPMAYSVSHVYSVARNNHRMLKNIIFDVDGTLVDSKRDIAAAQLWVFGQLGVHSYTAEQLYPYIGKPLKEVFALLLPAHLHNRIDEAVSMYIGYYRPRALDNTTLFPGVRQTIEALREMKVRMATATTKSSETTLRVLEHFGIERFFSQIQGSNDIPYKPDPFIINKILGDQSWEKTETLMVGDTDNDIEAGKRAGVPTCGVTYGSLTKEQILQLNPDFIIDSFPELLSLLRQEGRPAGR